MKRKILLISSIIALIAISALFILSRSKSDDFALTTTVKRGPLEILVYSSGQLEAQNSVNIVIPDKLRDRSLRINEIKITDLIEEGTVVDSGEYVASLDHKVVEDVLISAQEDLEMRFNYFEDAKMDSGLTLSNNRDLITNAKEDVEEMQIVLDESVYESPAVIRKAEMDLDKAKRRLNQEIKGYELKKQQAKTRVERYNIEVRQRQSRVDKLLEAIQSLEIKAPQPGMIIYVKDRSREKIKIGSTVSPWSPVIATLPDLSAMHSITYVNEIDISRLKIGQKVTLGIDALPDKLLEGEVFSVANIGQPMPKSDAKVFEVKIKVFGEVADLKPAMTTSNIIKTGQYSNTLFIPADAVFENDSLQFVLFDNGTRVVKKIVDLGDKNENFIIVNQGLNEDEVLLLTLPDNFDNLPFEGMDLYYKIKEREAKEEEETNKTVEQNKNETVQLNPLSSNNKRTP
ncbi:MAG: HlyD family efflux transporter periplasmic adaptor subunit [Prolixibacteraceae bacterium]|jgi:HlyD family secretion protein|nr:HlyD family efflux transporter periplasmic adaptor subunit [Prolixibacteraceae bacterium]MBT6007094.1 HlyD family efflux transporter periplasmic adaptor subunit [Prolixibacteraceae bacterium]MBT6765129.1 HlyD family efflux transporter periplasmic adaptor subunit [Prolixibacteraceae bacterium]MBT6999597.1 HlyD family efflux transporter periplasmic adaptor subunit [Prolixibacteraceae bacterium]MBT7396888.1 HlyD family efflux transporter periplasmic adaptor subunit [Prolixibacteraceae bacterium